jgi:type IV pilus assembly protein PilB
MWDDFEFEEDNVETDEKSEQRKTDQPPVQVPPPQNRPPQGHQQRPPQTPPPQNRPPQGHQQRPPQTPPPQNRPPQGQQQRPPQAPPPQGRPPQGQQQRPPQAPPPQGQQQRPPQTPPPQGRPPQGQQQRPPKTPPPQNPEEIVADDTGTGLVPVTPKQENKKGLSEYKNRGNLDSKSQQKGGVGHHHGAAEEDVEDFKGRIGDHLVQMGLITKDQLNVALQEKKITGKLLGQTMVDLGFIDEELLSLFLAESSGFEVFDPKGTIVDGDCLSLIDKKTAQKHQVMPVSVKGHEIRVAMSDPYDVVALDKLRSILPRNLTIKPLVTTSKILTGAIDATYGYASNIKDILKELENEKISADDLAKLDEDQAYTHPIVRLVNALVFDAVKMGASDLHFEPEENFVRLRNRIDGILHTQEIMHKQHWSGISQRLKIMAGMNIADKINAQDGRFELSIDGRRVDFRVSSLPTVHGENIVMRVLDQSESIMPLEGLGFSPDNLAKIKRAQSAPEGIIIVTGPTGSGKTTSLYSMLNEINAVEVNIQTLEDPVEYSLPMIRQTYVREGVLEFADGIKALLRQDPDIIFIGEIRDGETANMALKAAMTGHQVYTTLHTNDSFGALPRLLDLGLKPGMVAGAIIAIFAQRLTRSLCGACKEEYKPDEEECQKLGADPADPPTIYRAKKDTSCHVCGGSGYKGRTAVAEILMMDEDLDKLVAEGKPKGDLKEKAVEKGFKSMKDDGILKILEGKTSIEAVSRVVDLLKE